MHAHHSLFAVGMTTVSTEMETVHVGATYWPQVGQVLDGQVVTERGRVCFFFFLFFPVVHSTVLQEANSKRAPGRVEASAP